MSALLVILVAIFIAGAAIGAYALFAPRRAEVASPAAVPVESGPAEPRETLRFSNAEWANEAGAEFAGLSESGRCDLIFAIGALDDERSHHVLVRALDDPADAVALAAAHALARNGYRDDVLAYVRTNPSERAEHLEKTLALLD